MALEDLENCVLFSVLRLCGRVDENYGLLVTGFKVCCGLKTTESLA